LSGGGAVAPSPFVDRQDADILVSGLESVGGGSSKGMVAPMVAVPEMFIPVAI